jgi:hypothetical protein
MKHLDLAGLTRRPHYSLREGDANDSAQCSLTLTDFDPENLYEVACTLSQKTVNKTKTHVNSNR